MIKVYHTSPHQVERPDTAHSRRFLDFGKGFYVTSLIEQAKKYASRFADRQKVVWMNVYELGEDWAGWNVKVFERYDEEWLDFVTACRLGTDVSTDDLVVGGVANDKMFETIDAYFAGITPKEWALQRLRFELPNNQYCFRNEAMLRQCLTFEQAIAL